MQYPTYMAKTDLSIISNVAEESKFDVRLTDKKVEHGFLTRQERETYLKNLKAETEYEFTSAEALDADTGEAV